MKDLLKQLRETREFQVIMDELVSTRPVVPAYTPQKTRDETENLIERIKHESSRKQGWEMLYLAIVGRMPEEK